MTTHGPDTCELCHDMARVYPTISPEALATLRLSYVQAMGIVKTTPSAFYDHHRSLMELVDAELVSRVPRFHSDRRG